MAVAVPGVTLGERLGEGAFGQVYRGRHETLQVEVAVKLIDVSRLPASEQIRVLQEAQLMARLDHPNLLRVFDAGTVGEQAYIVVELMDGGSCAGLKRLDSAAAQAMTLQLTSGVQALHDARVLHRDIKPANCLRRARDQRIKLQTWGWPWRWPPTARAPSSPAPFHTWPRSSSTRRHASGPPPTSMRSG